MSGDDEERDEAIERAEKELDVARRVLIEGQAGASREWLTAAHDYHAWARSRYRIALRLPPMPALERVSSRQRLGPVAYPQERSAGRS